jgi:Uma2 family endonuclease
MLAVEEHVNEDRTPAPTPLPLENGERLHAREFLRRYRLMPQVKKAELIEGVVYMGSPVSVRHAEPDALIQGWLLLYAARESGVRVLTNATLVLDAENTVQPDAILRRLPEHGGVTRLTPEGYLAGPPELVVEIAASSASIDLRDKLRAYCRNGVQEYVVWRVSEQQLDWFYLDGDEYRPLAADSHGVFQSRVFSGLRLSASVLASGDAAQLRAFVES